MAQSALGRHVVSIHSYLQVQRNASVADFDAIMTTQCAGLQTQIRDAGTFSPEDASELLELLALGPWSPTMLSQLQRQVASGMAGPSHRVRSCAQVVNSFEEYMPASLVDELKQRSANMHECMLKVCDLMISLGLRNPSEKSLHHIHAVFLISTVAYEGVNSMTPQARFGSFVEFKRCWRTVSSKACMPPVSIRDYPWTARVFAAQYPALAASAYGDHVPLRAHASLRRNDIAMVETLTPCRKSNASLAGARTSLQPATSIANSGLEQCAAMMMNMQAHTLRLVSALARPGDAPPSSFASHPALGSVASSPLKLPRQFSTSSFGSALEGEHSGVIAQLPAELAVQAPSQPTKRSLSIEDMETAMAASYAEREKRKLEEVEDENETDELDEPTPLATPVRKRPATRHLCERPAMSNDVTCYKGGRIYTAMGDKGCRRRCYVRIGDRVERSFAFRPGEASEAESWQKSLEAIENDKRK